MLTPLQFAFVLLLATVVRGQATEVCLLEPEPGRCKAAFPRWYFDPTTSKCTQFIWGGCGGVVPFQSEKECLNAKCPKNACVLEPNPGPCRALIPRWFYNQDTGACEQFDWGGCNGVVPFQTESECRNARCNNACTQIPETGFCKARFIRWYFDNNSGKCTDFIWGGCGGSIPFESESDCETANCLPTPYPKPDPISAAERCALTPNAGPCTNTQERWYWDSKNGKCQSFKYGGCFGSVPFASSKECEQAGCGPSPCLLEPKDVTPRAGLCKALWKSWYYDRDSGRCKSFTYSGCNNVGPFRSQAGCRKARCDVRVCALGRPKLTTGCTLGEKRTWFFDGSGKCVRVMGDACDHGFVFDSRRQCKRAKCQSKRCDMTPRDVTARPSLVQCGPMPMPWYFDRISQKCVSFKRDGCEKRLPFPSKKKCLRSCI